MSDKQTRKMQVTGKCFKLTMLFEVMEDEDQDGTANQLAKVDDEAFFPTDDDVPVKTEEDLLAESGPGDDDRIIAVIDSVELGTSKNRNRQVVWTYRYNGQQVRHYTLLNGKDNNYHLLSNLEKLGFDDVDPSQIDNRFLQQLTGRQVEIVITQNSQYTTAQMINAL